MKSRVLELVSRDNAILHSDRSPRTTARSCANSEGHAKTGNSSSSKVQVGSTTWTIIFVAANVVQTITVLLVDLMKALDTVGLLLAEGAVLRCLTGLSLHIELRIEKRGPCIVDLEIHHSKPGSCRASSAWTRRGGVTPAMAPTPSSNIFVAPLPSDSRTDAAHMASQPIGGDSAEETSKADQKDVYKDFSRLIQTFRYLGEQAVPAEGT